MGELHDLAAWEQADRIRSGDLRATELLEHYLARIEEGDGALNAFCHLDREAAQATARDVDAAVASGEDPGKWAGVPVAIKELADVAGWPSEQGSLAFRGNVADHDGHLSPEEADMLTPVVRSGLDWARSSMVGQLGRAMEVRYRLQQAVAALFEDVDILLTPTTPNTAFAAEGPMPTEIAGRPCRPTMTAAFTIPFNLAGNAAASVPAGLSGDTLPVGLQIVGRRFDEDRILELSQIFEQVRPWPHRARPPGG